MTDTKYVVVVVPDEEDGGYYAYIPDLQGCMGDGETPQDAVEDVIAASYAWIEVQNERGAEVPNPGEESERLDQQMQEQADYIEKLENELAAANREIRVLKAQRKARFQYPRAGAGFRIAG
ncbi:type II toxin-antitoxin system HicB family antitoxin [Marimonas sp. MJW-29]|uniref:Type II toxin-antitoxin system HicB family antitoxin n=1 Tax=Sulfitobacter sediminis TaxID=3234186 RepID=A0ABV3RKF1_9RHOB